MRSEATSRRRSVATGDWRASSSTAFASSSSCRASRCGSAVTTRSARARSPSSSAVVASSSAVPTIWDMSTRSSTMCRRSLWYASRMGVLLSPVVPGAPPCSQGRMNGRRRSVNIRRPARELMGRPAPPAPRRDRRRFPLAYAVRVPLSALLVLAGAIGLVIGVAATLTLARTDRRSGPGPAPLDPVIPEAATEVLAILSSAYVVLDSAGDVLRASPLAYSYGIVRAGEGDYPRLASGELMELAADVGRNGGFRDERLTLQRSSHGDSEAVIDVRIGALGEHGALLLADDLTRAVRVEETRRDFVANVSHELKTPVGAITLLAETMEDAAEDPEAVRRFAARMQSETHRLSHLVQEIIELSRVQGSSALPDAEPVEVDEVVESAVALNRNYALGARIEVTVGGADGLQVFGSAPMLTTALSNLISNAIAYSDQRTRVGVSVRRDEGMIE